MQYRVTEGAASFDSSLGTRSIEAAALQAFTARVFEGLGMPEEDARHGGRGAGVGQPARHRLARGAARRRPTVTRWTTA